MYEIERPSDEEMERLTRRYSGVRPRLVRWDQREVDFTREMEDPRCFGEVVLLIRDPERRLAVVRGRGSPRDAFDLPTGVIEEGEHVEEAAMREAREETGREIAVDGLLSIYRVRVRWKAWDLERWFFVLRCLALSDEATPLDTDEIEEVKFVRVPEEIPESWSKVEWWGGDWRRRILKDGGFL